MNADSLKIILDLQEENVLLNRALVHAIIMLKGRKSHLTVRHDNESVRYLFKLIKELLDELEQVQKPADTSDNTEKNI